MFLDVPGWFCVLWHQRGRQSPEKNQILLVLVVVDKNVPTTTRTNLVWTPSPTQRKLNGRTVESTVLWSRRARVSGLSVGQVVVAGKPIHCITRHAVSRTQSTGSIVSDGARR